MIFGASRMGNMVQNNSVFWANGWRHFSIMIKDVIKSSVGILEACLEVPLQKFWEHLEKCAGHIWSKPVEERGIEYSISLAKSLVAFLHSDETCGKIFCWHFVIMVRGTSTENLGKFRETHWCHLVQIRRGKWFRIITFHGKMAGGISPQ